MPQILIFYILKYPRICQNSYHWDWNHPIQNMGGISTDFQSYFVKKQNFQTIIARYLLKIIQVSSNDWMYVLLE